MKTPSKSSGLFDMKGGEQGGFSKGAYRLLL